MKVGIWLESDYEPTTGGGFSYYDKLVKAIDTYSFHPSLDLCFVKEGDIADGAFQCDVITLKWQYAKTFRDRILLRIPFVRKYHRRELKSRLATLRSKAYREQLRAKGVQVLYYLNQAECCVPDFPFIATNWDIGHCSTYAFPELVENGDFERRHHFYTHILPRALNVFAESEAGKQELIRFTRIAEEKIKVVPIFAGNAIKQQLPKEEQQKVLEQYGLKRDRYFFYPAQFWAHKNHSNLIKAFASFITDYPDYKLVLTGSDQGNLPYVKTQVHKLGLDRCVLFPGFVPQEHINMFYQNATALVMASYFGPTNMPPIEAMELGCPVICSDIIGHHEILGEAAIYFELGEYTHIADAMVTMVADRESYVERIKKQQKQSKFTIETALKRIDQYLLELIPIRTTWA